MPKIPISGIVVLGFLELRDRVWEGTGVFSHAFGANQAQRAGSSTNVMDFHTSMDITVVAKLES